MGKKFRIRIEDKNGADVVEWFRSYNDIKVIGHVDYGQVFETELRYYMDTSAYYKIQYNGVDGYIYSGYAWPI